MRKGVLQSMGSSGRSTVPEFLGNWSQACTDWKSKCGWWYHIWTWYLTSGLRICTSAAHFLAWTPQIMYVFIDFTNGKRIHFGYSGPPLCVLWPISAASSSSYVWLCMLKIHPSSQCIQVRHQGTTDLRRKKEKDREALKFYWRNLGFVKSWGKVKQRADSSTSIWFSTRSSQNGSWNILKSCNPSRPIFFNR